MPFWFRPTWEKVRALENSRAQLDYIMSHDVRKVWKKDNFPSLSLGQQMAIRHWWLVAEVNNGQLDQYFWNSTGDWAADTIADLNRIGQTKASEILAAASIKLFGTAEPSTETSLRREAIIAHYGTHPFNDDDDYERLEVLKDKEDLSPETRRIRDHFGSINDALVAWILENTDQFPEITHKNG